MLMVVERLIIQVNYLNNILEWVVATINKKKLLSNEKLEAAFRLFDRDNSGYISAEEVRDVLGIGKNTNEKVWDEIVNEVDVNGDGEISFKEFK